MKTLIAIVCVIAFLPACKSDNDIEAMGLAHSPTEEVTLTTTSNYTELFVNLPNK